MVVDACDGDAGRSRPLPARSRQRAMQTEGERPPRLGGRVEPHIEWIGAGREDLRLIWLEHAGSRPTPHPRCRRARRRVEYRARGAPAPRRSRVQLRRRLSGAGSARVVAIRPRAYGPEALVLVGGEVPSGCCVGPHLRPRARGCRVVRSRDRRGRVLWAACRARLVPRHGPGPAGAVERRGLVHLRRLAGPSSLDSTDTHEGMHTTANFADLVILAVE